MTQFFRVSPNSVSLCYLLAVFKEISRDERVDADGLKIFPGLSEHSGYL